MLVKRYNRDANMAITTHPSYDGEGNNYILSCESFNSCAMKLEAKINRLEQERLIKLKKDKDAYEEFIGMVAYRPNNIVVSDSKLNIRDNQLYPCTCSKEKPASFIKQKMNYFKSLCKEEVQILKDNGYLDCCLVRYLENSSK